MPTEICLLRVILKDDPEPISVRWYPGSQHMYRVDQAGLSVGVPFGMSKVVLWAYAEIR